MAHVLAICAETSRGASCVVHLTVSLSVVVVALASTQCAKVLHGSDVDEIVQCGANYVASDNFDKALSHYRSAVTIAPVHLEVTQQLGMLLYRMGRFQESVDALQRALQLAPSDPPTRKVLGDAAAAAGDLERALQLYFTLAPTQVRPLSHALVRAWRTPLPTTPWRPLSRSDTGPPVLYADFMPYLPRSALHALRDFLSQEVVGASYGFEFQSRSVPVPLTGPRNLLEQAIEQVSHALPHPGRRMARCAEWWVHRRPPGPIAAGVTDLAVDGHHFHWDDDGPEAGESRHRPLFTTLLYLTDSAGVDSPTIILNITSTMQGDGAWVIHGTEGRVAVIHGEMLHGVLPSAGSFKVADKVGADGNVLVRLSLNVAWWSHDCRQPIQRAEKFPSADPLWADAMAAVAASAATPPWRAPRAVH